MKHLQVHEQLAAAYQILALWGHDDLTYTHLSARVPSEEAFWILPFGLCFEEVRAHNLVKVSFEGQSIEGEGTINPTGRAIHSSIYRARPDVHAVFHLHTHAGVAVSATHRGLLPLSQWALHFYDRIAYHDYDALIQDAASAGRALAQNLGDCPVMFLRHHGTLIAASDVAEALYYQHHLEQACRAQLSILAMDADPPMPSHQACLRARDELLGVEAHRGHRDFEAMLRRLRRHERSIEECNV